MPELLTRKEVAAYFKCHIRTIDRLRSSGKLAWINTNSEGGRPIVRFSWDNLVDFLRRATVPAKTNGDDR